MTLAPAQVSTNDFKNGLNIEVDGVPYKVGAQQRVLAHRGTPQSQPPLQATLLLAYTATASGATCWRAAGALPLSGTSEVHSRLAP